MYCMVSDNVCFCATIWYGRKVSIKSIRLVDHWVYQLVSFFIYSRNLSPTMGSSELSWRLQQASSKRSTCRSLISRSRYTSLNPSPYQGLGCYIGIAFRLIVSIWSRSFVEKDSTNLCNARRAPKHLSWVKQFLETIPYAYQQQRHRIRIFRYCCIAFSLIEHVIERYLLFRFIPHLASVWEV